MYLIITGKAGARRGGLYAVVGGKAAYLGSTKPPADVVRVEAEADIAALQKIIQGLA